MGVRDLEIAAAIVLFLALGAALLGFSVKAKIAEVALAANVVLSRRLLTVDGTRWFLRVEQPIFGNTQSGNGPCPKCDNAVAVTHIVQMVKTVPGGSSGPNIFFGPQSLVIETMVLFGPCGCRWESNAFSAVDECASNLLFTIDESGSVAFNEVLRDDKDQGQVVWSSTGRGLGCE